MSTAEKIRDIEIGPAVRDLQLLADTQQFYYREARLLDDRKYQQWFDLLLPEVAYTMPTRHTPFLDPKLRETEAVLNVEQELSDGMEPHLRDDNHLTLMIRATRSFKLSAWADNPPARTRRFVSNIEVFETDDPNKLFSYNNTLMTWSRHDRDNYTYSYQRQDVLVKDGDSYKLASRQVLLDWNVVVGPSVGLLF